MADNQPDISIKIYEGVSKEAKKPYKAILVTVGEWSKLIFTTSKFELDYVEKTLAENSN